MMPRLANSYWVTGASPTPRSEGEVVIASADPAAGCGGAVAAGWAVQRAVRRGCGFGRASLWGLLPVVLAAVEAAP